MTTAEEILNNYPRNGVPKDIYQSNFYTDKMILQAMEEYAQLKLSEHSALKEQEVVAWLCEKSGSPKHVIFNPEIIHANKVNGYTITELVKK